MKFLLLATLFFLHVTFATLFAEEVLKKEGLQKMIEPKVSFESAYLSEADLSGFDGGVTVTKNSLNINNELVGFSYTNWAFDWNGLANLPFGDGVHNPIEQMHGFKINANIPYFINENWFLLSSISLKSTFEKEADNSYGVGLFSFASYKISHEHAIQFGIFANYHPTATLALPAISYSYRARQSDGLKFVLGFPRTYVGYHVNKATLLRFGMLFSQSLIKLSQTSTIENSGFVEAKDYMSNVGFSYDFSDKLSLETDLLYSVKREFTLYSKDAQELDTYSIKPSLGVNFKVSYLCDITH